MADDQNSESRTTTKSSLIRDVQERRPDAWQRLTGLYGPLVFHWCRKMGLRGEDAADVFQEVFVAVHGAIHRFEPSADNGTFRGWMWTITRSKVQDHWRRNSHRESGAGGTTAHLQLASLVDPFCDDSHDPSDSAETTRLFHRALEFIQSEFEPRTWQAFWRAAVEHADTSLIAAELNMTPAAVRQAKSRVLRRLRRELGEG